MGDYNSTRSGNQYHGTDYASRMGQFDRMEAEARERARIAERNAAAAPRQVFDPPPIAWGGSSTSQPTLSSGSTGGSYVEGRSGSFAALGIVIACGAVWFGSALLISQLLIWLGVSATVASKIGLWTLPAMVGAAIAAFVGWVLWHVTVAIAKGIAAIWRGCVTFYRWVVKHRKPIAIASVYGLLVMGAYQLSVRLVPFDSPGLDWQHLTRLGICAVGVCIAIACMFVAVRLVSRVRAQRQLAAEIRRNRIAPTYVWNVGKGR